MDVESGLPPWSTISGPPIQWLPPIISFPLFFSRVRLEPWLIVARSSVDLFRLLLFVFACFFFALVILAASTGCFILFIVPAGNMFWIDVFMVDYFHFVVSLLLVILITITEFLELDYSTQKPCFIYSMFFVIRRLDSVALFPSYLGCESVFSSE